MSCVFYCCAFSLLLNYDCQNSLDSSTSSNEVNVMFILHLGEALSQEDVQTYLDHLLNFTDVLGNTSVSVRNVTIPKGENNYKLHVIEHYLASYSCFI